MWVKDHTGLKMLSANAFIGKTLISCMLLNFAKGEKPKKYEQVVKKSERNGLQSVRKEISMVLIKPHVREADCLIGGVMRCCMTTLDTTLVMEEEGEILPCKFCSSALIFRDGIWQWFREYKKEKK
jgi:hypothetical protein